MNMEKDKIKMCGICKLGIDESKEFAKVTHYKKKDKLIAECYYHINCYQQRINPSYDINKINAMASQILLKANDKIQELGF
jgi:hypothetical protein